MSIFKDKKNPDYGWKKPALLFLILCCLGVIADEAYGAEPSDFLSSTPDRPNEFRFFETTERVWVGPVDVLFNPTGSEGLGAGNVRQEIEWVIDYVKIYIDIDVSFQSDTQVVTTDSYDPSLQNTIIFNMADLSWPTLGQAWAAWGWGNTSALNNARASIDVDLQRSCLRGVVLHEFLHTLFIDHSETTHSIMSNNPYNSCEYNETLRLDDIEALQTLYPPKPNRQGVITSSDSTEACFYMPALVFGPDTYQVPACVPAAGFGELVRN